MGNEKSTNTSLTVFEQQLVAAEPEFKKLAVAAKRGIDYGREANFAMSIIKESEPLQKCALESFKEAFENLGAMGLSLNKNLGQAALIPRWNAKRKKNWATVMPMYRGYIALATGGSVIKNVWGASVVDGDTIEFELGSHPKLRHVPLLGKRNDTSRLPSFANMIGAYCIADITGSSHPHITWLSIDDIVSIAERSDSFNPKPRDEWVDGQKTGKKYTPKPSGPWVTDPGQMAVKSAFRRAFKTWPGIDREEYRPLQEAVRVDTAAEVLEQQPPKEETPIEGEAVTYLSQGEVEAIRKMAKEKGLREARLCEAYSVESLERVPAERYLEIKKRVESFGSRRKAA